MGYAEDAVAALHRIGSKHSNGVLTHLEKLSKGEGFVLNLLVTRGGTATPGELSQVACSSTARIAVILGKLEQKAQIVREIDKADRRKVQVTITEAGLRRVDRIQQEALKVGLDIFQEMGERDTADFLRLLDRFLEIASRNMEKNA